ncbi:EpsG family protein [Pedobacter puniceum]|uniref:EpsG family protein n=1 Tax=Pedobacter puniceum TaxID=2666136 RepID=A0A7K0FRM6_9SPHI|nr:EpsG family protein [Pedobacter puniceum]MRX48659.1 hypothetical protein [Pedobacter puniceum]
MYLFTFFLLFFFAIDDVFLKKGNYKLALILTAILWLIFHDGFRWGVGTDWKIYHDFFLNCLDNNTDKFEIGYNTMSKLVRALTDHYSAFLILHALIVYILISRSIIKYAVNPLLTIFLFYCLMLGYLGMNRQYISFAICIFSYQFIFKRKFIYFILCIFIALLFHSSALLFIFAYFLHKKLKTKYIVTLLILFFLISVSGIINKLPLNIFFLLSESIGDKASFYKENQFLDTNIVFTVLALLKRSIWIILGIIFYKQIKNRDTYFDFFFNIYLVGTLIYILFNNTLLQIVVSRGILYYNIGEVFLIPYILTIFKNDITKKLMFVLIAIYGFLTIQKSINFYKVDLGVDIFRPYNSVFEDDTYDAMER